MTEQATANEVLQMANYVQSHLPEVNMFCYGDEPEMQIDFHIPCDEEHRLVADTLAALIPCLSRQHVASAFHAGEHVQLSLHKEPSAELAEAFFQEALGRIASDESLASQVAEQIQRNREEEIARVKARMERLQKLKAKQSEETAH